MAFDIFLVALNHIRAMTSIFTSKQASKKTDFTVDLTWWGSLRLSLITGLTLLFPAYAEEVGSD